MTHGLVVMLWIVPLVMLLHLAIHELSCRLKHRLDDDPAVVSALLIMGIVFWVAFWCYYAARWLGVVYSIGIAVALATSIGLRFSSSRDIRSYVNSAKLLWPVTTVTLLLLFIGLYPFPVDWAGWSWPAHRWISLPVDNSLPKIFADQIWNGHVKSPMTGDWLSSDRPPLQTGAYLLFKPLWPSVGGVYQVIATWLQCTLLAPLIVLMRALGLTRKTGMLAIIVVSVCPSFVINSVFVWPKLIAATYVAAFYLGLFPSSAAKLTPATRIFWISAGAALSMLSHGGAIFSLIGIALAFVLYDRGRSISLIARSIGFSLLIYLPWILYQNLIDPPGTRLITYHLAGHTQPTAKPLLDMLRNAYSAISFDQWWDGRVANFDRIFHGSMDFFKDLPHLVNHALHGSYSAKPLVENAFYHVAFSLGFFTGLTALAALIHLSFRGGIKGDAFKPLFVSSLLTCIVWSLLMFVPASTAPFEGSYFLSFSALLLSMALVRQCGVTVFNIVSILNVLLFLVAFVFDRQLATSQQPVPGSVSVYLAVTLVFCTFHFLACRAAATDRGLSELTSDRHDVLEGNSPALDAPQPAA